MNRIKGTDKRRGLPLLDMVSSLASLVFGVAALSAVAHARVPLPTGYHRFAPRNNGLNWENCSDATGEVVRECSRFEVPLDWHDDAAGKASLLVARYRAVKEPKLGTLFMNPGGPGESGVDIILSGTADRLMEASGGRYDIVSWDPRGVGATVPKTGCFKDAAEEAAFWEGTIPAAGIEARGNFTDQRDLDEFYSQVDEVDSLLKQLGERCIQYSPNTFQYIGSAAAVRDMVAIHDVLEGKDKPVNYWGLSYGTVIGSYFVNMFPDRVGRVVIDGVVDPVYYANKRAHKLWEVTTESTDEAFTGFCLACAKAGPGSCAIAQEGSTTESIRQWTLDLIDAAYEYRRAVGPSAEISSSAVRNVVLQGMYQPTGWSDLANTLAQVHAFLANATTTFNSTSIKRAPILRPSLQLRQNPDNTTAEPAKDYAIDGITCADAADAGNITTKDVFDFLVHVTRTVSPMFGPSWGEAGFGCHRWPVRAVERFTGPWNSKLANTILVIGNEADPVTPFISAKRVAHALGKSAVLLEQDDYGHLSLAMKSTCTIGALKNYFLHNKLPKKGKFCGTDQVLFPGPGITKSSLKSLDSGANTFAANAGVSSDLEDELERSRRYGRNMTIAVIALVMAVGLFAFSFFLVLRSRRRPVVDMLPRDSFEKASEDGRRMSYPGPYMSGPTANSKGYSKLELR